MRAVRVGGNLNSGNRANYGLFYRNANNNPGNRNWNYGSALILTSTGRSLERLFCRIKDIFAHHDPWIREDLKCVRLEQLSRLIETL